MSPIGNWIIPLIPILSSRPNSLILIGIGSSYKPFFKGLKKAWLAATTAYISMAEESQRAWIKGFKAYKYHQLIGSSLPG